ncbi:hypothetical protein B0H12DRAFT_701988 [Mycena haematopus]|nr:hypothetical protein B0H12DRAFT_701988 [Mycena haematopus]
MDTAHFQLKGRLWTRAPFEFWRSLICIFSPFPRLALQSSEAQKIHKTRQLLVYSFLSVPACCQTQSNHYLSPAPIGVLNRGRFSCARLRHLFSHIPFSETGRTALRLQDLDIILSPGSISLVSTGAITIEPRTSLYCDSDFLCWGFLFRIFFWPRGLFLTHEMAARVCYRRGFCRPPMRRYDYAIIARKLTRGQPEHKKSTLQQLPKPGESSVE